MKITTTAPREQSLATNNAIRELGIVPEYGPSATLADATDFAIEADEQTAPKVIAALDALKLSHETAG